MKSMKRFFAMILGSAAFGVLAAPAADKPPQRVAALIETKCALCHGASGDSASAVYPRLAAQHPAYLVKQLNDFRSGRRKSDTMGEMAKDLTDEETADLANWFSKRKPASRPASDSDLAAVGKYIFHRGNSYSGVPACASCHGVAGAGTELLPRLAGQHPSYIEVQLKEFGKRERTNDNAVMHSVATKLTELETRAVAVYLGGL
jgi:cytochrome c553